MVYIGQVLVVGVGVDGGHQALLDAQFALQHLGHRRQAVGGAGGVGDDLHVRRQHLFVDAIHHGGVGTLGGRGDQDLARAGCKMCGGLVAFGEQPGAFEHHIDLMGFPRQLGRVANGADGDAVTLDPQAFAVHFNFFREMAVDAVILQQVGIDRAVAQIVDRHDLQVLAIILGIECA